jgi:hypothetical protein
VSSSQRGRIPALVIGSISGETLLPPTSGKAQRGAAVPTPAQRLPKNPARRFRAGEVAVDTRGGSRMRESRTYGSERGARGNSRPYRDEGAKQSWRDQPVQVRPR